MNQVLPHSITSRRAAMWLAAGTGIIAVAALLGWLVGNWRPLALGQGYVPMAPSTAWCLLLLAVSTWLRQARPAAGPGARFIGQTSVAVTLVISILVLGMNLAGLDPPVEAWLSRVKDRVAGVPVGRMSPLAALNFLAGGLACWFELPPLADRPWFRQAAAFLGLGVLLTGITVLVSYALDAPLLYASGTIPMALLTAMAFVLLALAMVITAGPDTWPLSLFGGDKARVSGQVPVSFWMTNRFITTLFVLFTAFIIASGYFYLKFQLMAFRQKSQDELTAVAALKASIIAHWYRERLGDARVILDNPMVQDQSLNFLRNPTDSSARRHLEVWMESIRLHYKYRLVALHGADGVARLVVPARTGTVVRAGLDKFHTALAAGKITITDLHRDPGFDQADLNTIHLTLWVPVAGLSGPGRPAAGLWEMQIDPEHFLYPLVQTWPTASRTAETLLVRREGDEVVFLNDLRHRPGAALALRLPIATDSRLPAAMAARAIEGVIEGLDYRGGRVLAATKRIPGTPWFLVAKVDLEEIYAPLRHRALFVGGLICFEILAVALGVSLLWRHRDNQWLSRQLAERRLAEAEIRRLNTELEERVRWRTAQLEAANRELEAFSYSVSHDLRAPLRHLTGFVNLLLKLGSHDPEEKRRHYLTVIAEAANTMGCLIDEILSFSRMGRAEMLKQAIDMDDLVNETLLLVRRDLGDRKISWSVGRLPVAHGDPQMLKLVWTNLLVNAVKFTAKKTGAAIEIAALAGGPTEDIFYVKDNGAGFDMRYADKLFSMFQRLHRLEEFEGTGVGLANVRRIIDRHGGRTWAEGAVDQGATFYFSLPRTTEH